MPYKPVRDRGVYRAAANPKSPIHDWAVKLVEALTQGIPGILKWCYRDKGEFSVANLTYADNPFLACIPKEEPVGAYYPVPLKIRKEKP